MFNLIIQSAEILFIRAFLPFVRALLFHVIPSYQRAHIDAVHVAVGIMYKVLTKGHVSEKRTLREHEVRVSVCCRLNFEAFITDELLAYYSSPEMVGFFLCP